LKLPTKNNHTACKIWVARIFEAALLLTTLTLGFPPPCRADTGAGITFDGQLRSRVEAADWLNAADSAIESDYLFAHTKLQLGAGYSREQLTAYVQGEHFQLYDLPAAPAAGPGGAYGAANHNEHSPGALSLRQLWIGYAIPSENQMLELKGGRFLYANGSEFTNKNESLEAIKKQRIHNRLIGPFEFTAGRSFDGGQIKYSRLSEGGVALSAFRPTQGGFAANITEEIEDITVIAAALSPNLGERRDSQLFAYYYDDSRDTVKTDNRALDLRQADDDAIQIITLGAHDIESFPVGDASLHVVAWGAFQAGDWGDQKHSAAAFALEGGVLWKDSWAKPRLRIGYDWSSGDSSSADDRHETFFQMLPTSRQYALTPFFDQMNMADAFVQAQIAPIDRLSVGVELHFLSAANANDLLYAGGGANLSRGPFGFTGTELSHSRQIGWLPQVTIDFAATSWLSTTLFLGHLVKGAALDSAAERDLTYGFWEMTLKF